MRSVDAWKRIQALRRHDDEQTDAQFPEWQSGGFDGACRHRLLQCAAVRFLGGGGDRSPFIFNAAWRIGLAVGSVVFLMTFYRSLVFSRIVWKLAWQRVASLPMALWIISYFTIVLYASATQFIDVSITAVLYETWPIALVFMTGWLFKTEGRYRRITHLSGFLFVIALVGVVFVIASQAGGLDAFGSVRSITLPALVFGAFLALGAAFLAALTASGFKWATNLASDLTDAEVGRRESLELFSVILGTAISNLINLPLTALAGFARDEPLSWATIAFGAAGGLVAGAIPAIGWRKANLIAHNLELNLMLYLTPALALGWLGVFSLIGDINIWGLTAGVTLIVLANGGLYLYLSNEETTPPEVDVNALIADGESDTVEFKSTLRVNTHTNKNDDRMTFAALRAMASLLNTDGGTLIIGVGDKGEPVGVGKDNFPNEDEMSLYLRNRATTRMGATVMTYVTLQYADYRGSKVLAVICEAAANPVYLKEGNNQHFFIRTGPSTTEPPISEAHDYINRRFGS